MFIILDKNNQFIGYFIFNKCVCLEHILYIRSNLNKLL